MKTWIVFFYFFLSFSPIFSQGIVEKINQINDSLRLNFPFSKKIEMEKRGKELSSNYKEHPELTKHYFSFVLSLGYHKIHSLEVDSKLIQEYEKYYEQLGKENFLERDSMRVEYGLLLSSFYQIKFEFDKAKEVLLETKKENNATDYQYIILNQNIATIYLRQKKYDSSITFIDKTISYSKVLNDSDLISTNLLIKGNILFKNKEYIKSYKSFDLASLYCTVKESEKQIVIANYKGYIYSIIGDYERAIYFNKTALSILNNSNQSLFYKIKLNLDISENYLNLSEWDSCFFYINKINNIDSLSFDEFKIKKNLCLQHYYFYSNNKNTDSSFYYLQKAKQISTTFKHEKAAYFKSIIHYLYALKLFEEEEYAKSNLYIDSSMVYDFSKEIELNYFISSKNVYVLASKIKNKTKDYLGARENITYALDIAEQLYEKKIEAGIINEVLSKNLDKEKDKFEIAIKKEEEKQKQSVFKLILFFVSACIIIYLLFKYRRIRLKNKLLQLNDKFSQTQIAPHFIANTLANIQSKILEDKKLEASDMIGDFSELSNLLLINIREKSVTLKKEIELVSKYLYFQEIRKNNFTYEINTPENAELEKIVIPPLVSLPFIENAIKHGFIQINRMGHVKVIYTILKDYFQIEIEDNGNGMDKTEVLEQQSNYYHIIKERLIIFNQYFSKNNFSIHIDSKIDVGTKALIKIPYKLKP